VVQPKQKYWARLPCFYVAEKKEGVMVTVVSGYCLENILEQTNRLGSFGTGQHIYLEALPAHVQIASKIQQAGQESSRRRLRFGRQSCGAMDAHLLIALWSSQLTPTKKPFMCWPPLIDC
jgi:hypothetical protein